MSTLKSKKAIVALSGGVDSSVATILLKEQGYQVEGVFMRLGIAGDNQAEKNAKEIAGKLGIKFRAVDLSREFKKKIISYFISEYEKGKTPNPCVECNREIKFGILMDEALKNKTDFIATGHYINVIARESQRPKQSRDYAQRVKSRDCFVAFSFATLAQAPRNDSVAYKLLKAYDKNKDQSYFLYNLNQKILKRCLFPLGDYTKDEVRKIAKKHKLEIHNPTVIF